MTSTDLSHDEDRILRVWTPILLRTILTAAASILVIGLVLVTTKAPGYYVARFHAVQGGEIRHSMSFAALISGALAGKPHEVLMVGLFVLTLVPLGRVAFCFMLFTRKRDYTYVVLTGYVLFGLALGVFLGRIG